MKTGIFALLTVFSTLTLLQCSEYITDGVKLGSNTDNYTINSTDMGLSLSITGELNGSIIVDAIYNTDNLTVSLSDADGNTPIDDLRDISSRPADSYTASFNSSTGTLTIKSTSLTINITDSEAPIIEPNNNTTLFISNIDGVPIVTKVIYDLNDSDKQTLTIIDITNNTVTVIYSDGSKVITIIASDGSANKIEIDSSGDVTRINGETIECPNGKIIFGPDGLQDIVSDQNYCLGIDITLTENFVPIGSVLSPFTGTLDGRGNSITNLNIDKLAEDHIGLFVSIGKGGQVKDLTIKNPTVKGEDNVGVLAGWNEGTIDNVKVERTDNTIMVEGGGLGSIGGLVGNNGGISNEIGIIKNSYAIGDVSGTGRVGGLVGNNKKMSIITDSYATGDVSGTGSYVGGLVGKDTGEKIENSYATGDVRGTSDIGGLVGGGSATINNSYATGDVTGTGSYVGGLVGNSSTTINNSYATGDVTGTGVVGGLVGSSTVTINNSYATGDVTGTGTGKVGGLVGYNNKGNVYNCYAGGKVLPEEGNYVGGFIGLNYTDATITNSYFDAETAEQENAVGTDYNNQSANVTGYSTNSSGTVVNSGDPNDVVASSITEDDFKGDTTVDDWDFTTIWFWESDGQWPTLRR